MTGAPGKIAVFLMAHPRLPKWMKCLVWDSLYVVNRHDEKAVDLVAVCDECDREEIRYITLFKKLYSRHGQVCLILRRASGLWTWSLELVRCACLGILLWRLDCMFGCLDGLSGWVNCLCTCAEIPWKLASRMAHVCLGVYTFTVTG